MGVGAVQRAVVMGVLLRRYTGPSFSLSPSVWMDGFCSAMASVVHVFIVWTV